ncbi:hypothetical protein [Wenyingzhuangia sp. 2_MG-2023]|uniref:hypothetical protein n=1 Tax=Wenyingzhuangia sp. 2_MG-2023 TaxID=3062639 RepID=UPI0026E126B2|nr:hypothetical protein [Wenyingzhuangia sp. 2_MG-2023]MDO6737378.1 hypothetical protein [Wenyingzhuangia sp. 2_MG-2023]
MIENKKNYRDSRYDFERDLNLLHEVLIDGKIRFTKESSKSIDAIKKVRYSPNQRIDLNTINELVRVTAMMVSNQKDTQEYEK